MWTSAGPTFPGCPKISQLLRGFGIGPERNRPFGSDVEDAHFFGVVLQKAKFQKSTLYNTVFAPGDRVCDLLSGYTLKQCNLTGATLTDAKFDKATMDHAFLNGVQNTGELIRVAESSREYACFFFRRCNSTARPT